MTLEKSKNLSSSFRDPSGFLFFKDDNLYRQINHSYKEHYEFLISSGLFAKLVDSKLLINHKEVELSENEGHYKIIKPDNIALISYPYEWSFSQLKDAALLTLKIQSIAMDFGMTLKDASAYNVQFHDGRPILIDTLSFEKYMKNKHWHPYGQFCRHFFAPLAIMSFSDIRLNQLLRVFVDGIPLDLANKLLPFRSKLRFSIFTHIHLHSKSQKKYESQNPDKKLERGVTKIAILGLIDNLKSGITKLKWEPKGTEWGEYYDDTNYSDSGIVSKKEIIEGFIDESAPSAVWDLGGNIGMFSRIVSDKGIKTYCFDVDPAAVEKNYTETIDQKESNLLPLLLDLTNPSPDLGWANEERDSILNRSLPDLVMALALIHHLAISNNVPIPMIARFFSRIAKNLIIEFVPKEDSQVKRLLSTREDIFVHYTQHEFENQFSKFYTIKHAKNVTGSSRTLYLMERH